MSEFWKRLMAKHAGPHKPQYAFDNGVARQYLGVYDDYSAPHCDPKVLHAPGFCDVCDEFPIYQKARELWGIAFTRTDSTDPGHPDLLPCPAECARPVSSISRWAGNWPTKDPAARPPLTDVVLEMTNPEEIERVIGRLRDLKKELEADGTSGDT